MREGNVVLAQPRGLCAGVRRAIGMVERALNLHGAPVYVRKEIVHNHYIVSELQKRGAVFVDSEEEVPQRVWGSRTRPCALVCGFRLRVHSR